jgi:myosin-1
MSHIDFKRAPTVGVEDLVLLPNLADKAIMENLKLRHSKDLIYTTIGNVLISVNPFKKLPIYTEEQIAYYRSHGKSSSAPHVFALAEDTYRTMIQEEENQCVIISGESGAGKTEASKQIMQYVAAVSGNSAEMQRVKQIILESNPLLEAFGNAKTVRNDNSSRFGKFFEIYFDRVGGPVGGHMSNFLLEKSRVVKQQRGERNFHIFYQICAGADPALKQKLRLKPAGEFFFLNQGSTLERAGVDDAVEWKETLHAMDGIGIAPTDQESIFRVLGTILHLGEIKFQPGSGDECTISNKDTLQYVAELMGVEITDLERALLWKKLEMSNEVVNVPQDIQQCTNSRDAIAKALYDKLFNFVVDSVNRAFGEKKYALMLGVLDIYGFEIFDKNGFEQFCINYVNEKLQQIFIELTLKVEQEEYVREKIPWEEIKYFNNKIVCELIEGKQPPGLFSVIDDVCAAMAKEKEAVADIKMLDKLDGAHCGNPHFKRTDRGFMIKHYAGDVHYDAAGFTTRNKDTLSNDIILVMSSTKDSFLQELLIDITSEASPAGSPVTGQAKKKSTTSGFKIRQQAADLVKTLTSCTPHYVRTIKSNDEKRANFIDDARVTHQVKYLGLLENIRVRRAGYSYRQYFDKFLKRFKYTCPATFPRPFRGTDKDACAAILNHVGVVPKEAWNLGVSKLFIRQPQHLFALEDAREAAFGSIVLKIQRAWTRYRNSKEYIVLKTNMDKIYRKGGKERRADSVFKPYQGDYLNYRGNLQMLHPLVDFDVISNAWKEYWADGGKRYYFNFITNQTQWIKPHEMSQQRIIFTDKVDRVVNHDKALTAKEFFIVSDRALYLIEEQVTTIVTPPTKPTKQNPKPAPPPAPYQVTTFVLKKRLDIRLISGLSVSQQADKLVVIHFYPAPVPYRAVAMTQVVKGVPPMCQLCGVKLPPAAKKGNCPGCGVLACMKTCLVQQRPLPTLGYPKPVPVCPHCMTGEPFEPVEDVILLNPGKSEIVAMLRKVYKQVMGHKIPINVNNSISYQLYGEKAARTAVFQLNPAAREDALYAAPNQLVVHCPPGIQQAKIAAIEAARDERRKIAQERYKKEQEEAKIKEAQKEAEREEQRRRMVEERKAAKREAEERAEADRQERERLARERRETAARVVSAKSSK